MLSPRVYPASLTLAAAGVDMRLGRAGLCISGMKCDEPLHGQRVRIPGGLPASVARTLGPSPWALVFLSVVRWG